MDSLLEAIRGAIATDANDDARSAGASACRTIIIALEAKPGEPLAPPQPQNQPAETVATVVAALRNVGPDQLLDLAIARLRAALPPGDTVAPARPMQFNLVPVPPLGGRT